MKRPLTLNPIKFITPDFFTGRLIGIIYTISRGLRLLVHDPSKQSFHLVMLILRLRPKYTMVTNKNLIVLYNIVQAVNAADLPGDIVECGVWRGGSAAMMARANLEDRNRCAERRIWLFDSFQGLPPPGKKDGEMERKNYFEGWNRGSTSDVRRAFDTVGVPLDGVEIVPGWFNVTLGRAPVDRIAVLHIDADWYDSTKLVLDALYDKVIPGGFIILNDYGAWPGCNRALADFFQERALGDIRLHQVEPDTGAYFKKP